MRWLATSTFFLTAILCVLVVFTVHGLSPKAAGIYVWVMEPIPESELRKGPIATDRTLVLVVLENEYRINQDEITRAALASKVSEVYRTRAEKVLLVYGEPTISHQRMMEVLTEVQARSPDLHLVLIPPGANVWSWQVRVPRSERLWPNSPRPPWAEGGSIQVH